MLEHIQDDVAAIAEMVRVLKPGGHFAATVPAWLPEKINWMLSDEYHAPKSEGGHVRIYSSTELAAKLRAAGLELHGSHRAHALHSPYWWLKCAVGPRNDDHPAVRKYREFLEWDIMEQPNATRLPFPDSSFDVVITSEVLEHIQDDITAITEMVRVLKPGGRFAATVPAWLPEKINWMLSDEYHAPKSEGGHVRIYSKTELRAKLRSAGLELTGGHKAHALHAPYWWLKCAVGPRDDDHRLVAQYRRFLEWDITSQPSSTRLADRVLSRAIGKSIVFYGRKVGAGATA